MDLCVNVEFVYVTSECTVTYDMICIPLSHKEYADIGIFLHWCFFFHSFRYNTIFVPPWQQIHQIFPRTHKEVSYISHNENLDNKKQAFKKYIAVSLK